MDNIYPESKKIILNAKIESSLAEINFDKKYQFLRLGYFVLDKQSNKDNLIFGSNKGFSVSNGLIRFCPSKP